MPTPHSPRPPRPRWTAVRRVLNAVNLSTPAGWLLARAHGVRPRRGPHGLLLATGYPRTFPALRNPAVTIGDVVLLRMADSDLAGRPRLLDHEARHADQWAALVGPVGFLPLYGLASLWSWLRTGNPAWANVFETMAGLADGGYRPRPRGQRRRAPGPHRDSGTGAGGPAVGPAVRPKGRGSRRP